MLIGESRNPVSIPQENIVKPEVKKKSPVDTGAIDFDKMLGESNSERLAEIQKEKNAVVDGEYHVGETKNDKEFREQLEKITGKKQDKAKNKLEQADYLNLLVTQLKYQDPSKPMEHYEMASQMAQFNTVEQLVGMNKTLTNFTKNQSEAKLDKLSQYLDKYVEVQGSQLKLNESNANPMIRFELPSKASTVSLEIKDNQGKVVRTMSLGVMESGSHSINWDGKNNQTEKASPGEYTFNINASSEDGKPIPAKTTFIAKVNGVTDVVGEGKLDTTAGLIEPSKIVSIRNYEKQNEEKKIVKAALNEKGENHGVNQ